MKKIDKKRAKILKTKLPKYPNILGRDRFFNSAVLIPLVNIKNKSYLLFQKRAANIRQGGDICFPGGGFDKKLDKNFKDTVYRELFEELGLKRKDIQIYGQMDSFSTTIGAIIEPFVGKIKKNSLKNLKIDKNEVEKIVLIPLSFFKKTKPEVYTLKHQVLPYEIDENGEKIVHFPVEKLNLPIAYHKPWGNKNHKVWVYKYKEEVIWGITSVLINEFLKYLNSQN
ncbi:NUDIX hydrolase [Arcobacter vandammei]|uniref:NUDIX hydrolase n=1 Tax=Arcobacter vandammei TaxID=2782243 RepID=UPI0018E04CBB|nr:CoA pyrophosphatase [Arcobacter vandammei]